ncbi:MAG: tetratricopeptide repeat protein [Venatoribacter sp.]
MSELRTEEEQVEALRKWWKDNGTSVLLALVIGLAGYFGFNYWKSQQQAQVESAALLYNQLVQIAANPVPSAAEKQSMTAIATELKTEYSGSAYADFGTLFLARFASDAGDFDSAAAELKALTENAKNAPVKYTAQARLAQILVQQEKFDDALALVKTVPDAAFAVQFEEVKGDALYRKGQLDEARAAYQRALEAAQTQGINPQLLQRKIDSLTAAGDA